MEIGLSQPAYDEIKTKLRAAQAIGMADRGEFAGGKRADFIRMQEAAGMPIVRGSWCRGERAF